MKVRTLPDSFGVIFGWSMTVLIVAGAIANPERSFVKIPMFWFMPLLAVAWTAGFIAMRRLKSRFKDEYESLGSPQMFGKPFDDSSWRFLFYLLGFRFLRLSDRVVTTGFSILGGFSLFALLILIWSWVRE